MAARYSDPFLNALMYPHQMTCRAELIWQGSIIANIPVVSGSVTVDRQSTVRRTLDAELDPTYAPKVITDRLTPYGSVIRVYRGIRWPNNDITENVVFLGRVDSVEFGRLSLRVRASDLGGFIADARFEKPYTATRNMLIIDQMKALITDAYAAATFTVNTTSTARITTPATWDRERADALDNLAETIGCEWYASADGTFHIDPLPALSAASAVWVIDTGDTGVTITRETALDRQAVYNAVVVNGEPPDGQAPAYGVARDANPASLTMWGGPFGKVPRFFSSQFIYTNTQAQNTALSMLGDAVTSTQSVNVGCVANPRLMSGQVVLIQDTLSPSAWDGLYFINSMTLPLDPESAMSLVGKMTVKATTVSGEDVIFERSPIRLAEGISYGDYPTD